MTMGFPFLIWKIPERLRWIYGKGGTICRKLCGIMGWRFFTVSSAAVFVASFFWQYRHFVCKERRSGMKEIMDTYGEMLLAVVTTVMLGILFWQEIKSPFGMGLALALEQMFG